MMGECGFLQAKLILTSTNHATRACGRTLALLDFKPARQNKWLLWRKKGKNVRFWDRLQSTVWDKSTIPCENGSHLNLWISSRLHWFKLWLMEQNKRPVLGTCVEAHQIMPNWTRAGLAWWYNRAGNYQGLFQLAWYGLVLCYYTVCSVK